MSGCIDGDIGVGTISPGGKLAKNGDQTALKETHNHSEKARLSMKFDMSACSARSLQYLSSKSVSSASTCLLLSSTPSSCAEGCPASCDIFLMSTALLCCSQHVLLIYSQRPHTTTNLVPSCYCAFSRIHALSVAPRTLVAL